jgi:hypothetical protein
MSSLGFNEENYYYQLSNREFNKSERKTINTIIIGIFTCFILFCTHGYVAELERALPGRQVDKRWRASLEKYWRR